MGLIFFRKINNYYYAMKEEYYMAKINNDMKQYFKDMNKKKVFIRARKKHEKLHYIGYVTRGQLYGDKVHVNSWLFRFGGYEEVRYYNPKTKKLVGTWTLEKHNNYCKEHGYNDMVWTENGYYLVLEKRKKKTCNKKEVVESKSETLREYLDRINVENGSDAGFIVQELYKNTEMHVSRRYLECEAWKYLLDKKIVDYMTTVDIYGNETIKFILD